MDDILIVKALDKFFQAEANADGRVVLDGVDFTVGKGEFVGVLGASGSGKSALMGILMGLDNASGGSAFVDGRDVTRMPKDEVVVFRREKIGMLFRDYKLLENLTAKENIALPLILNGKSPGEIDVLVDGMMDFLGIEWLGERAVYDLSDEEKQQVAAARVLVVNPVILLADEPTGNMNSFSAENILQMLTVMNEDSGTTILMATHDPFVVSYCQRVLFMRDGKIVAEIKRGGDRVAFLENILAAELKLRTFATFEGSKPSDELSTADDEEFAK